MGIGILSVFITTVSPVPGELPTGAWQANVLPEPLRPPETAAFHRLKVLSASSSPARIWSLVSSVLSPSPCQISVFVPKATELSKLTTGSPLKTTSSRTHSSFYALTLWSSSPLLSTPHATPLYMLAPTWNAVVLFSSKSIQAFNRYLPSGRCADTM